MAVDCFNIGTFLIALIAPLGILIDSYFGDPITQPSRNPEEVIRKPDQVKRVVTILLLVLGFGLIGLGGILSCPF